MISGEGVGLAHALPSVEVSVRGCVGHLPVLVQMWAEAVMRQVERVREIRKKAYALGHAYERMEGPEPR